MDESGDKQGHHSVITTAIDINHSEKNWPLMSPSGPSVPSTE